MSILICLVGNWVWSAFYLWIRGLCYVVLVGWAHVKALKEKKAKGFHFLPTLVHSLFFFLFVTYVDDTQR